MVIADLCVVDKAPAERALPRAGREQLAVRRLDVFDDARQRGGDIPGEVAAVGAWVTDQLVPLVQRLREIQRPLRAEPKQAVGVALQFGEVVEQKGVTGRAFPLSADSIAAAPARARATIALSPLRPSTLAGAFTSRDLAPRRETRSRA